MSSFYYSIYVKSQSDSHAYATIKYSRMSLSNYDVTTLLKFE